jgi:hypothetical protein
MNRDTFPGTKPYARATAAAGSARSLRSIRSHTRRRLHEPRPPATPETRKRIGQWKAEIKAATKARQIRAADRLYADELLAFPSVARGHYSLCSDATMGQRLDVSDSTARRQRRRLDKAGLIEVLGYGRDGNSCLVRPVGRALGRWSSCLRSPREGRPVFRAKLHRCSTRGLASSQIKNPDKITVVPHRFGWIEFPCPTIQLPSASVGTTAGRELRVEAKIPARDFSIGPSIGGKKSPGSAGVLAAAQAAATASIFDFLQEEIIAQVWPRKVDPYL